MSSGGQFAVSPDMHEPIGYIPPVEAGANYDRQLARQASTVEA